MAYKNLVITPPQLKNVSKTKTSQFYRGFSTVDESTSNVKLYDFDLIKQDILNQFNTRKGERVMFPNEGTIIWDLIFEPLTADVKQLIADDIDRIVNSDPRVVPTLINIVEQDYGFLLELTLTYKGSDVSEDMILNFNRDSALAK